MLRHAVALNKISGMFQLGQVFDEPPRPLHDHAIVAEWTSNIARCIARLTALAVPLAGLEHAPTDIIAGDDGGTWPSQLYDPGTKIPLTEEER
eukprot:gene7169-15531_t